MAILPMKRILICGMKKDRKEVLEFLQRQGVVEITSPAAQDDVFTSTDMTSSSVQFSRSADTCEAALKVLDTLAPAKSGLLADYTIIDREEYEKQVALCGETMKKADKIVRLNKEIAELTAEIPRLEIQNEILEPWKNLDIPLDYEGTKNTKTIAGTLAGKQTLAEIYRQISELAPEADAYDVEIVSTSHDDPEMTCILVIVHKDQADLIEDALWHMDFSKAPLSSLNPAEEIVSYNKQIEEDKKQIEEAREAIISMADEREHIRFAHDYYAMRADKYDALGRLAQTERTFILSGYLAKRDVPKIEPKLSEMDVLVEVSDPEPGEDVPVKLRNNAFTSPMESVVANYSMPNTREIDPSAVMAIFYYVFFGLMLSDAAYGLIITIACAVCLTKYKNMAAGMKKFMKMFLYCGISTTIWGFLFGGFFGDAVNVIATTFFNRPDIKLPALWFEPVASPMKLLVYAFVFGIIHLFVGLGIQMYEQIRDGDIKGAIYDVVFWYMLVGGLIVCVMTVPMLMQDMFQLSFVLPLSVRKVSLIIALLGAIGIVFTAGRDSKNWVKRIMKGLYGVYGVSGYLSDILSYSRLLALGLATGVIATVFNAMAAMVAKGKGIVGVILFIIIFVIGHAMNLAINALGAYVHTNRLQYVEFFGKFYEGGGRELDPLTENTKYYRVKEAK